MKIVFYVYDPKNLAREGRTEIQFKTYIHGVYSS